MGNPPKGDLFYIYIITRISYKVNGYVEKFYALHRIILWDTLNLFEFCLLQCVFFAICVKNTQKHMLFEYKLAPNKHFSLPRIRFLFKFT